MRFTFVDSEGLVHRGARWNEYTVVPWCRIELYMMTGKARSGSLLTTAPKTDDITCLWCVVEQQWD